jgi:hypothetical protein
MKMIRSISIAFAVACAICGANAAAAFAEGEWLANGEAITSALTVDTLGTFNLINLKSAGGIVLVEVECSGLFEGTVGPAGAGSVTDLISLSGETIGDLGDTNEKKLNCTVVATAKELGDCTATGELAEVLPTNLNLELGTTWTTALESMESTYLDKFPATSGYEVSCKTSLGTLENKCEGVTSAFLQNIESEKGVLGVFDQESEASNCTLTGEKTGTIEGSGIITLTSGQTLTVKAAIIEAVPNPVPFGMIEPGGMPIEKVIKFLNLGPGAWNPGAASIIVGPATFLIEGNTCNKAIAAGNECEVKIKFAPAAAGNYLGILELAPFVGLGGGVRMTGEQL